MSQPNSSPDSGTLDRALSLVRFLREHCPWDAAQTPASLLPYLLEEAHETADAIGQGDDRELASELGDLLLNVAFQIVLAEERNAFDAETVVTGLEQKMQRRHPHLYGLGPAVPWEELKAREREEASDHANDADSKGILHGIASGLDPLSKAHRIQDRVSAVGFDWADYRGAYDKVSEELAEAGQAIESKDADHIEEEIGDLLFAVVNLARLAGTHPLNALQRANAKFSDRFAKLEQLAKQRDVILGSATLEELDALWNEIKVLRG